MKSPFDEKVYTSISLTKLTIFAISKVVENGEECAYERVVNECFTLFPKRFSFQRYPEWPDGARLKIEILRCRDNGWVTGNEKNGFQITSLGKRVAEEVLKELQQGPARELRPTQTRDRGDTVLSYLRKSEPYKRYQENKENFIITEEEFRRLIISTFETPPKVLEQNFNYCLDLCREYGEKELCNFLEKCREQKSLLLKSWTKRKKVKRRRAKK
jgi:predicted transcriptional regulator